jgi:hypothetical protein
MEPGKGVYDDRLYTHGPDDTLDMYRDDVEKNKSTHREAPGMSSIKIAEGIFNDVCKLITS